MPTPNYLRVMKRRVLLAVVLLAGLASAQTIPRLTVSLTVPRQPIQTIPAPAATINGLSLNVFRTSLSGSTGMPATGAVAYPQSFPAMSNKTEVPLALTVPDKGPDASIGKFDPPVTGGVADYSCATARPDFSYQPGKLNFQAQSTSDLGQVDMNFWTGLPPGTNRYVPLGEF